MLQPLPLFVSCEAELQGGVDVLLERWRKRAHVEAGLAVEMLHECGRDLDIAAGATAQRHEVEADVMLLLDDAGEPKLVLLAAIDDKRLLDDEVIVTLVSYCSFAHGK